MSLKPRSVLVSACLLGEACRYDGATCPRPELEAWAAARRAEGWQLTPICPEELGELGTPRPPAELKGGDGEAVWAGAAQVRRVEDDGDVTEAFVAGARRAREAAPSAATALLKARSPSCGVNATWIDGEVRQGDGVFAALLRSQGVALHTEEGPLP